MTAPSAHGLRLASAGAALAALLLTGPLAHAQPGATNGARTLPPDVNGARAAAASARGAASVVRRATVRQLTGQNSLTLRGTDGSATVAFGSRSDTLITGARLHLKYSHSPSLIVEQSHLKVLLNDELVGVAPFGKVTGGGPNALSIDIDPRLVADFNRLRFQFIGHYADACEDQLHSALWAEVSGTSELELTLQPVPLVSELGVLPEPFFDARDLNPVVLPFVLPAAPPTPALRAAGVVASWFGVLADWRTARFPVQYDRPPRGHAVVLATNDARPEFLRERAPVEQPTLTVIDNPVDRVSKLLLVQGRDAEQLAQAAQALVLGHAALSGASAQVREIAAPPPRQAYDAPRWVRTDRPTRFGELVSDPKALQAFGHSGERVRIPLRIPPDLFTWRSRGVPVDLRFRHNAPTMHEGASRLTMSVNDELIRSFNLDPTTPADTAQRTRVALLDPVLRAGQGSARLPAFALGPRNQLDIAFDFGIPRDGACRDRFVPNIRGEIDPDSTVDFSGYPHYVALPHLGHFATAGYPFTTHADLSQTAVVLPRQPSAEAVSAYLTLMGRMGESTGHPALRVRLADAEDDTALSGADLLVIGSAPQQTLLERWQAHLPAIVTATQRRLNLPAEGTRFVYDWFGLGSTPQTQAAGHAEIAPAGPIGALLGLQHPLSPRRSVVVLTASADERLGDVLDALDDTGKVRAMNGSVVFVRAGTVSSWLVGPTYMVGSIPPWTRVWYPVSRYPLLVGVLGLIVSALFAFLLWRALRRAIARRLAQRG